MLRFTLSSSITLALWTAYSLALGCGPEESAALSGDPEEQLDEQWLQAEGWTHIELPQLRASDSISFDARVSGNAADAVIGASLGKASAYSGLTANVRFNPDGLIDVRDADEYRADASFAYQAGERYFFTLDLDHVSQTYSVQVASGGDDPVELGSGARFRLSNPGLSETDTLALFEKSDGLEIANVKVNGVSIALPSDEPGPEKDSIAPSGGLWSVNFNQSPLGLYTDAQLRSEWPDVVYTLTYDRANIIEEDGNRFVRINYPEGGVGHQNGGALWKTGFSESRDEFYIAYRVRFKEGFNFALGGKLPGMFGGEGNTGGNKPTGTDGWSARMNWKSEGQLINYLYNPDQEGFYGDQIYWGTNLPSGEWITLENRIVINDPGQRNGILESWYNSEKVLQLSDIRYRDVDSFAIDGFLFSTFFGGQGQQWAPTRDEHTDFDDFVFSDSPITH